MSTPAYVLFTDPRCFGTASGGIDAGTRVHARAANGVELMGTSRVSGLDDAYAGVADMVRVLTTRDEGSVAQALGDVDLGLDMVLDVETVRQLVASARRDGRKRNAFAARRRSMPHDNSAEELV